MNKGFLFTIATIFFASTLVFFAQGFYDANLSMERKIVSSALPLNIISLNEDLSTDLEKLLQVGVDVNSINKSIVLDGKMNSNSNISDSLSKFSSFINDKFFIRSTFDKTLDLSNLTDGKAEFFIGDKLNLDYNYGNSLALFSSSPSYLESIDLNLQTTGTLVSYEWVKSAGSNNFLVSINYTDDSNAIIISDSVDNSFVSYLKLVYPDGNTLIDFGKINYLGVDYTSAFVINSKPDQVINYKLKANYADLNAYPVKINSVLSVKSANLDSNTMLILFK